MKEYGTDILLIHPNDQKAVYGDTMKYTACEPPYWCGVVAQYCREKGLNVKVIDAEALDLSFEQVADETILVDPALVGIFVTGTNLSASTQKMQGADATCHEIKKRRAISVFMWGLHPSALPVRTLEENDADYIVAGEGLETIVNLCLLHKGENISLTNEMLGGLFYRNDGKVEHLGESKLFDTAELPLPAWDLLPMECYMPHNWHIMGEAEPRDAKGRYGVVSTSIGCPYNCSYCAISALFGTKKLRFWDVNRVVEEIERLVTEYNVKYIKILDECFVLKKEFVLDICNKLIEKELNINAWCYARIDTVDEEILDKLYRAGIKWIAYGIESGDDTVLGDVLKSQYTVEKTKRVMEWTKKAGINTIANFMFGLPMDTQKSMEKTLQLARDINPEWINFYVTMQYPGSRDYFDDVERGKKRNDKWIEYAQYSYECKPAGGKYLTPKEVLSFRDYAFNAFFENNDTYFEMIKKKFGQRYVDDIKNMLKNKLRRQLLEPFY